MKIKINDLVKNINEGEQTIYLVLGIMDDKQLQVYPFAYIECEKKSYLFKQQDLEKVGYLY